MLSDNRLKEIHDYPNSSDCFPGVTVGGVSFFLWEQSYNGDCLVCTYQKGKMLSQMKRPLREKRF